MHAMLLAAPLAPLQMQERPDPIPDRQSSYHGRRAELPCEIGQITTPCGLRNNTRGQSRDCDRNQGPSQNPLRRHDLVPHFHMQITLFRNQLRCLSRINTMIGTHRNATALKTATLWSLFRL